MAVVIQRDAHDARPTTGMTSSASASPIVTAAKERLPSGVMGPLVLVVALVTVGGVAFVRFDQGIGLVCFALAALVTVDHFIVKTYRKHRTLEQRRRSWGIKD